jgi:hypothetical protein
MKHMKTLACAAALRPAACGTGGPTTVDLAQRKARNLVAWAARTNIYAGRASRWDDPGRTKARCAEAHRAGIDHSRLE